MRWLPFNIFLVDFGRHPKDQCLSNTCFTMGTTSVFAMELVVGMVVLTLGCWILSKLRKFGVKSADSETNVLVLEVSTGKELCVETAHAHVDVDEAPSAQSESETADVTPSAHRSGEDEVEHPGSPIPRGPRNRRDLSQLSVPSPTKFNLKRPKSSDCLPIPVQAAFSEEPYFPSAPGPPTPEGMTRVRLDANSECFVVAHPLQRRARRRKLEKRTDYETEQRGEQSPPRPASPSNACISATLELVFPTTTTSDTAAAATGETSTSTSLFAVDPKRNGETLEDELDLGLEGAFRMILQPHQLTKFVVDVTHLLTDLLS